MPTIEADGKEYSGDKLYREEAVLRELYAEQELTQNEIADLLDCGSSAISRWLRKHDIETRQGRGDYDSQSPWVDEALLRELYVEQERSSVEIAEEFGCCKQTVCNWLENHEIERRDISEARSMVFDSDPVSFFTSPDGYEMWTDNHRGETTQVKVHRLLAVAERGFETVADKHVHHGKEGGKFPACEIPWANWGGNIDLLTNSEHGVLHGRKRVADGSFEDSHDRDGEGNFI